MRLFVLLTFFAGLIFATGISIDGRLDEKEWAHAKEYGGFRNLKGREQLKNQPTWFKLIQADNGVYVGVNCTEPNIAGIKEPEKLPENHGNVFNRDHIELFFSPAKDRDSYYQFAIDIGNSKWCQYFVEGGNSAFEKFHCLWESAVHRGKDFWSVEIFIPYSAFYHTFSSDLASEWYINVGRQRKSAKPLETTCWSPLVASFTEPYNFNTVRGFKPKTPAMDFSIRGMKYTVTGEKDGFLNGTVTIDLATTVAKKAGKIDLGSPFNCTLKHPALKNGNNVLNFTNIKVPADSNGKFFSTKIDFGELGGRYYKFMIQYIPCVIKLDTPCYRNSFYPDETPEYIEGTLFANVENGTEITMTIAGAGLDQSKKLKITDGKVNFSFDAGKMEIGTALITVNAGKYTSKLEVKRLPMPANGQWSRINREGVYVRNGKPEFFLGWRGGEGYLVSKKNLKRWPHAKDRCPVVNSLGSELWIDNLVKPEMPRATRDVEPSPEYMAKLREQILKHKDKNLMGWMLGEEPECRNISPVYLKYAYDLIKELDPYNPVICCTRSPREYIGTADLFRVHPYLSPVEDEKGNRKMKSPTFIGKVCNEASEAGQGRKGLWVTLGFFAYNFINSWATPPNYDECSCMTWTAVINGAKGFFTYIYYQTFESHELMLASDFLYISLDRLSGYIMSNEADGDVDVISDSPVEARIKRKDGRYILIVSNQSPAPADATITSSLLKSRLLEFRGDRTFTPEKGRLELKLAPYEAFVLTTHKEDEGLEKLSSLRAKVKEHNDKAANSGNILYGRGREIEFSTGSKTFFTGNSSVLKNLLTNGVDHDLAWRSKTLNNSLEMIFQAFDPVFNRIVIHGALLDGLELYSWERGKYNKLQPDEVKKEQFRTEFIFKEKQEVVKLKLQIPKYRAELYEVEMY